MKKLVIAVVVLGLLLGVAPYGIGKIAERRVDRQVDLIAGAVPFLAVVERKYTPGWFHSQQDVTFELLDPSRALDPGSTVKRFTVHNDIQHGPLPGFTGLGVARVDSRVALDEKTRREMIEAIGTDDPFRVSTSIGFFGGMTTTLSSDQRTVKIKGGDEDVSWDDLRLRVSYTSSLDSIDMVGDWPRVEVKNAKTREHVVVEGLSLDGTSERIGGDLYDTDAEFHVKSMKSTNPAGKQFDIRDLRYAVETSLDGDFVSYALKLGTGKIAGNDMKKFVGGDIEELHYDFTLRRLHEKTLERLMTAIKDSYTTKAPPGVSDEIAALGPVKAQAVELFKHDPELVVDRLGLSTADGGAYLTGVLRAKNVTEQDLAAAGLGIFGKIEADLKFDAVQAVIDKIEGGAGWAAQMVEQGMLLRTGKNYTTHLEYQGGQLKVNGKAQGIPGLGAPPPQSPSQPMTPE